jgi:hypothetical protein
MRPSVSPTPNPADSGSGADACSGDTNYYSCDAYITVRWFSATDEYYDAKKKIFAAYKEYIEFSAARSYGYSTSTKFVSYSYDWSIGAWVDTTIDYTMNIDWNYADCDRKVTLMAALDDTTALEDYITTYVATYSTDNGEIIAVTVNANTCSASGTSSAFGTVTDDGTVSLPFSTWNLNTYDASDWFLLIFIMLTVCLLMFVCGWCIHKRKIKKAIEESNISEFAMGDTTDLNQTGTGSKKKMSADKRVELNASNDDYHNFETDAANHTQQLSDGHEDEIEIGVSVAQLHSNVIADDSD